MKILSREIRANEETFAPEMILTISMVLVKEGDLEINQYELVFDDLLKALKEYEAQNE